ncbi:hypothetical protein ACVL5V_002671 [Bradyrhizobium ottawaense]
MGSVTVCGVSGLARHRLQACGKVGIVELAEHGATNRGAERRQAIADLQSAREHARRAASGNEHDVIAVEHRERGDFVRRGRNAIEQRLNHGDELVGPQVRCRQRQHMRCQREQLAIAADKTAALEREQHTSGGGARQVRGAGEIAQRHRAGRRAEALQQAQAAIERFDEIRRALVGLAPLQFGHGDGTILQNSACCCSKACHNSPIRSIGEQTPLHRGMLLP